ncbi:hypothetical protein HK405_014321 [Cladochytrium tenue]|nr:hypothetical protein HK405_014321 [Cladochytrium tenue]
MAMPYSEESKESRRRGQLSDRQRRMAEQSSIMRDLADTFGVRPEEESAHGTGVGPRDRGAGDVMEQLAAIERAEEENYTRYSRSRELTKKEKQLRRRAGVAAVEDEIAALDSHFDNFWAVDQAVREDEFDQFGGGLLGKRKRRAAAGGEDDFDGGVGKRRTSDLIATASKAAAIDGDPLARARRVVRVEKNKAKQKQLKKKRKN